MDGLARVRGGGAIRSGLNAERKNHLPSSSLPIAAALNPINAIAPSSRAAVEEECGQRQMISLPPYFYAIFTPLSVRASENLATADKLFPGALYCI